MANKEMRITESDLAILKSLFAENEAALKTLRKVFLPEITGDEPVGQIIDLWLTLPIDSYKDANEAVINMKARNLTITHIEQCLVRLLSLAGKKNETIEQTKRRLEQDSSK